jgi:REP element-mobilizing transposase RayT
MHWVFVSNSRRRVFDARAIDVLRGIFFADVCPDTQTTLAEMDRQDDHVHLPISIVRQHTEQQRTPD